MLANPRTLRKESNCDKWKKPELQTLIRWKQIGEAEGERAKSSVSQNKPVLLKLWKEKYATMAVPEAETWTAADEAKLNRNRAGEIVNFLVMSASIDAWMLRMSICP